MVRKEMTYSFEDLTSRQLTESWITLSCVSNPVGGDLVGNARWSGVRIADLLAEAGVLNGADCVRQTSWDGWDCAAPLAALTNRARRAACGGHERQAAADRARISGAFDRPGTLRFRLGDQIGSRLRGHSLR